MSQTGSLLRHVLMVLLLTHSCGSKRRCNFTEILGSFREVISVELQNLNLTSSANTRRDRDLCPSGKARLILLSIYGTTQQIRCQRSGKQLSDLEKPLEKMEQLITHNCSPEYLGNRVLCSGVKRIRGKKRKRKRLKKVITALITCWRKLQTVLVRLK